jgi:hypothetical protein
MGFYAVGAAPPDDKCDAVLRLYDVYGDVINQWQALFHCALLIASFAQGFLTQENLLQISDDIGGVRAP